MVSETATATTAITGDIVPFPPVDISARGMPRDLNIFNEVSSPEEHRQNLQEMRTRLLRAVAQGLTEAERYINDPHTTPYIKLKATEILFRFADRTGLVREVQESEADRNLDSEILALVESISSDDAGQRAVDGEGEARLLELAAAQGYEIEFVDDDEREAG
jgi:hypothetical protein